jgi:hypothetical protein
MILTTITITITIIRMDRMEEEHRITVIRFVELVDLVHLPVEIGVAITAGDLSLRAVQLDTLRAVQLDTLRAVQLHTPPHGLNCVIHTRIVQEALIVMMLTNATSVRIYTRCLTSIVIAMMVIAVQIHFSPTVKEIHLIVQHLQLDPHIVRPQSLHLIHLRLPHQLLLNLRLVHLHQPHLPLLPLHLLRLPLLRIPLLRLHQLRLHLLRIHLIPLHLIHQPPLSLRLPHQLLLNLHLLRLRLIHQHLLHLRLPRQLQRPVTLTQKEVTLIQFVE